MFMFACVAFIFLSEFPCFTLSSNSGLERML